MDFEVLIKNLFDISNTNLVMYAKLKLIRATEILISERYSDQIFRCPVHLSIGQEAIAVGVSQNLNLGDKVISTHRSHAHYIAKGGNLFSMFSELIGSPLGCCKGRGGSMHIFDHAVGFIASIPIVGSSLPIAAGLALAEKLSGTGNIVVAYIGDAALETGAFYESLNLVALKKLPILIVLEDNDYSTFSNKAVRWADNKNVKNSIEGMGILYCNENGDDLERVYNIVHKVLPEVRNNNPFLLHFNTFRRYEHCGPNIDDNLNYRTDNEIKSFRERDPFEKFRKEIINSGKYSEDLLENINLSITKYVQAILEEAMLKHKEPSILFQENQL